MIAADIEKQEERMRKITLDSWQIELKWTAGEIKANAYTVYHNNAKNLMCNAMKEANLKMK